MRGLQINEFPFVSVIIPMFNEGEKIRECLEALLHQSYPSNKYEVIVVSDGSTDNSEAIVEGFQNETGTVIHLIRQENQGAGSARNLGAKIAKGTILLFIDADCLAHNYWMEEMIKPIILDNATGVQGAYRTRQEELAARFSQIEFNERYKKLGENKYVDFIGSFSAAYLKEVFFHYQGFNAALKMNEDVDLSFRMFSAGYKLFFNPAAIVYHRHPDSILRYAKTKFWRGFWRTIIYSKFKGKIMKDSYTPFSLKIQSALILMIYATVIFSFIFPKLIFFSLFLLILNTVAMLRFIISAFKQDSVIGCVSFFFLWLRACAISGGIFFAFVTFLFFRNRFINNLNF